MSGTIKRLAGPAYLAAAAADVITTPASTMYDVVRHIHIANKTAGAITFTLYVGTTGGSAAGTELFGAKSVAANDVYDYYCTLRLLGGTDYLTGLASAATSLVITIEGERFVV